MKSLIFTLIFITPIFCQADIPSKSAIFKQEQDGKVVYSSKPMPNAQLAKLPELGRWKIQPSPTGGLTCEKHGGMDCTLGRDSDGSIICRDGFKDAITPFNELCTKAKLEALGKPTLGEQGIVTFAIRNSRASEAQEVVLEYHPNKFDPPTKLSGPASIEPFGVAEYSFKNEKLRNAPKLSQIVVSCANCQ